MSQAPTFKEGGGTILADEWLTRAGMDVEQALRGRGWDHLAVRVYGKSLIIYSGRREDPEYRARLIHLGGGRYRLDMRSVADRWEATPFLGPADDLLRHLIDDFGFVLAPW